MLDIIIENKELIKLIYGIIVTLICVFIVLRTDKLFRLSMHHGIRFFRNAFFFYGIAFAIRHVLPTIYSCPATTKFFFEFFIIMAGFFLLFSLIWKKFEISKQKLYSSLFNKKLLIFYTMAFVVVLLDYIWSAFCFMFLSQIILFISASIISYVNFRKKGSQRKFLKFYFVAMMLSLIAWILNAIAALYLEWSPVALISIYILNIIIFLLFLYGIINVIK